MEMEQEVCCLFPALYHLKMKKQSLSTGGQMVGLAQEGRKEYDRLRWLKIKQNPEYYARKLAANRETSKQFRQRQRRKRLELEQQMSFCTWFLAELAKREGQKARKRASSRRHYERLKQDPERYARRIELMRAANRAFYARRMNVMGAAANAAPWARGQYDQKQETFHKRRKAQNRVNSRRYYERLKLDPERYTRRKERMRAVANGKKFDLPLKMMSWSSHTQWH
ncbi:hypothetical protein ACOMHN_022969 [Nucella lapillus]